jgi:trans-2,3-dihydro-3-hydroxyanthranilate isomerase
VTMREYVIVDVFTDTPLEGNPVAVFLDGSGVSGEAMQRTARELNLSETVFLLEAEAEAEADGDGEGEADARARIFTPGLELPFAGHPVLGAAFVLGERLRTDDVRLLTGAGVIPISLRREGETIAYGEMDQPVPTPQPFEQEAELLAAVGVERSELPVEAYSNGPLHVYVVLPDEAAVASLEPDLRALAQLDGSLGVSCFAGEGTRYKTRMFAPAAGVPEDPATGSAAGPLAFHLHRHGRISLGDRLEIRQGEEIGRPSLLHARVEGVGEAEGVEERVQRVVVGGGAVVVARGEYRLE